MLSINKLRKINIALLSTTLLCCVSLNQSFADSKTAFYNDPALAEKYKKLSDNQRLKSLNSGKSTKLQADLKICGAIKNTSQKVRIKSIDLQGVDHISGEIKSIYEPLIGSYSSVSKINEVAREIEKYYQKNGQILTLAYIPEQSFNKGVVKINVIAGSIREVIVEGDVVKSELFKAYVDKILELQPVSKKSLVKYLLLMNKIPGYQIEHVFEPVPPNQIDLSTGKIADLVLVVNRSHGALDFNIDNYGSKDLGRYEGGLGIELLSPFNKDESFFGFLGTTNKPNNLKAITVGANKNIGSEGTIIGVMGSYDISAANKDAATGLHKDDQGTLLRTHISNYPILTNTTSVKLEAGLQNRTKKTFNGITVQSKYNIASAFIGTEVQYKDKFGAYSYFVPMLYKAINDLSNVKIYDPTIPKYKSNYTLLTGNFERDQPLIGNTSLYLSANGQYTNSILPPEEQFSIGGMINGRGYKIAVVSASKGIGATAEFRYNKDIDQALLKRLQPYAFYDIAGFSKSQALANVSNLGSTGVGARFMFMKNINLTIEAGVPLRKNINVNGSNIRNKTKYSFILNKSFNW
jgi:hemolysin activation/secretion protein